MAELAGVRRLRSVVWLMVLALLMTSGCSGPGSGRPAPDGAHVVSYSGAAERLDVLDPLEADEQLRDWARLGLASSLGLDRDRIVEALYDTTPVRDPAFTDLVEQPTGLGRALFDGTTLHLLVPQDDDPHPSRTIGLLLDEHRADAGADPAQVQVHRYQVHKENRTIELMADAPAPTADVRLANGWTEMRVDGMQGLDTFLSDTSYLSRLETKGSEILAAGWRWPDVPGANAKVTVEDVSALQRGYLQAYGGQPDATLPGFSLDPKPDSGSPATVEDIRAAIPELDPGLAERILTGNWVGSAYATAADLATRVQNILSGNEASAPGLPVDQVRLFALYNLLTRGVAYSQARYDGLLTDTEVGKTLFYTDYVAKDWTTGVGDGVPSRAVRGFVPDPQAPTPPSLCRLEEDPESESGRLWFGQNDTGFAFEPNGVAIGAQATRLFSRSDGFDGSEVEPSYGFGRGLRFWDQHYQNVADYEPQYHRLEQLMRWSGVLEWLASTGGALPQLPDGEISSDLTFADWYNTHDELRERKPLTLVTPPSAAGMEAVLPTPVVTPPPPGCPTSREVPGGTLELLEIRGGVSLANELTLSRDVPSDGAATLPVGFQRAGLFDPANTGFDQGTRSGRIDRITVGAKGDQGQVTDRVTVNIRSDVDGVSVEAVGSARRSLTFAGTRLGSDTGPRRHETRFQSNEHDISADVALQGVPFGGVDVRASGSRETVLTWRSGLLGLLQGALDKIRQDPVRGLDALPGIRYDYEVTSGRVYRFDRFWIEIGNGLASSSSLRVIFAVKIETASGTVVPVSVGVPRRLSDADVAALEVTETFSTTFDELRLPGKLPPNATVYVGDRVGAEPVATLPAPIPSDMRFKVRVARLAPSDSPARDGAVASEGRSWSLVDVDSGSVAPTTAAPGGPGTGPPADGGGGGGGGSTPSGIPLPIPPPACDSVAPTTTAPSSGASASGTAAACSGNGPDSGPLVAPGPIVLLTPCPVGQQPPDEECN